MVIDTKKHSKFSGNRDERKGTENYIYEESVVLIGTSELRLAGAGHVAVDVNFEIEQPFLRFLHLSPGQNIASFLRVGRKKANHLRHSQELTKHFWFPQDNSEDASSFVYRLVQGHGSASHSLCF